MKIFFYTLGCKVNQYETDAMAGILEKEGCRIVSDSQGADYSIINSCTVTDSSDKKIKQLINKIKKENPDTTLVLTGCYAKKEQEKLIQNKKIEKIKGKKNKNKIKK